MNGPNRHISLETALKEAGFAIAGTQRQGEKTVITVFRPGHPGVSPQALNRGEKGPGTPP